MRHALQRVPAERSGEENHLGSGCGGTGPESSPGICAEYAVGADFAPHYRDALAVLLAEARGEPLLLDELGDLFDQFLLVRRFLGILVECLGHDLIRFYQLIIEHALQGALRHAAPFMSVLPTRASTVEGTQQEWSRQRQRRVPRQVVGVRGSPSSERPCPILNCTMMSERIGMSRGCACSAPCTSSFS
jgi:hypothetical protein